MTDMLVKSNAQFIEAAFRLIGTSVVDELDPVVRDQADVLIAKIRRNASGRPGPRAITGDYRRSWDKRKRASNSGSTWEVGTNSPQGRRLERGFFGTDSLGRCVDSETEILSAQGWKRHDSLAIGELVYTLNPDTWLMEWRPVEDIVRFENEATTHIRGRTLSAVATPDHRWLVERYYGRKKTWVREWRTTESLNPQTRIPLVQKSAAAPLIETIDDDIVELAAWFWTEGHYGWSRQFGGDGTKARKPTDRPISIGIAQSESVYPQNVGRIRRLLTRIFGEPGRFADGAHWNERLQSNGVIHFKIDRVGAWLLEGHVQRPNKAVEPSFLRALTTSQLELFVDVSILADGSVDQNGVTKLGQSDIGRIRSWEMACALAGRPTVTRPDRTMFITTLLRSSYTYAFSAAVRKDRNSTASITHGRSALVWCPVVETGTWLARRDGMVYVTGNCYRQRPYVHVAPAVNEVQQSLNSAVATTVRKAIERHRSQ